MKTARVLVLVAFSACAFGQSFNLHFSVSPGPSSGYAAAGRAGLWNTLRGDEGVYYPLTDVDGLPTVVRMRNAGGPFLIDENHPATAGDLEALLDHYRATRSVVETCLRFENLQNGAYQVIAYAWLPLAPSLRNRVLVDESTEAPQMIGGDFPGGLQFGVTHAVFIANVTAGVLNVHSGLAAPSQPVSALNGVQLRRPGPLDGNVGMGQGGPFDTLTINGSPRTVRLVVGQALTLAIAQPPTTGMPSGFLLFGMIGVPGPSDTTVLPLGMGTMAFPPCVLAPQDPRLFSLANSFALGLCGGSIPASRAPWTLALPGGLPVPVQLTLQGVIEETPGIFRVSNAVTLDVR